MANEEPNKSSSNLKVPPLKIVLSSHQSSSNDHFVERKESAEGNRRNSLASDTTDGDNKHGKRNPKGAASSSDSVHNHESESGRAAAGFSSSSSNSSNSSSPSSSSSSSSDSPSSTSPSTESESMASNSTIISEQQTQYVNKQNKSDTHKDDTTSGKERVSATINRSYGVIGANNSGSSANVGKKSNDPEQASDSNASATNNNTTNSKEQTLNANQRITRSSQRAAQQNKVDNPNEPNGDESVSSENQQQQQQQDKIHESARKVKRRKGEPQEVEQDSAQTETQPTIVMADICPADYQLPSQNSFELYRDIRNRPYKKLLKLSHTLPKEPYGFRDYLLSGGPYLLDGNKLGVGMNGAKFDNWHSDQVKNNGNNSTSRTKLSNLQQQKLKSYYQLANQRHTSYNIPKISEAPKNLQVGSALYELFLDQEKARHQMRMQHLKERERSTLAVEQEILRAYNRAAIANMNQKRHLSACTYFYYQERYHYLDEESDSSGKANSKEVPHSQDNSFLCIEGGEAAAKPTENNNNTESRTNHTDSKEDVTKTMSEEDLKVFNEDIFLNQLQEIDDKWDKIKKEMLVRHKNEADSLYAVQSLEWEWKAKEIGSCDVRVSLRIEPECVPRVDVFASEY